MLFPTLEFGIFFLLVFALSWTLYRAQTWRKLVLLAASYFFYGYWDWRFLALLAGSTTLNYVAGISIDRADDERRRKWIIGLAIAGNLAVLGFFKYFGFFTEQVGAALTQLGLEREIILFEVILPIGISFFTFQGISYLMDIYRGSLKPVREPVDLYLYISFFPQLVAGPIVRAADFLPQLRQLPDLTRKSVALGFILIAVGLFKKMIIASYLASGLVDPVFSAPGAFSSVDLMIAAWGFAIQIYCDFSGYSDIAIGVAALLGYHFKINFDRPLGATTTQDLWRRWHISLSSWLRDYLYRPLKGDARGKAANYRSLFLTMLLAGLWHGAAWTFVLWGGLQGLILIIEREVKSLWKKVSPARLVAASSKADLAMGATGKMFGWFVTFNIFALAAIFFRSEDLQIASEFFSGLWAMTTEVDQITPFVAALLVLSVAGQHVPPRLPEMTASALENAGPVTMGIGLGLALLAIELLGPEGVAPFIYFQF